MKNSKYISIPHSLNILRHTHSASDMLRQNSGESSPTPKQGNMFKSMYAAQQLADISPSDFYMSGDFKPLF